MSASYTTHSSLQPAQDSQWLGYPLKVQQLSIRSAHGASSCRWVPDPGRAKIPALRDVIGLLTCNHFNAAAGNLPAPPEASLYVRLEAEARWRPGGCS
jgi:hypothetical protein